MSAEYGIPAYPTDRRAGYRPPAPVHFTDTREQVQGKQGDGHGFSFGDLIDAVNPLQHIPVVSSIYRRLTGDEIDMLPRVAGGAIFGGLIGGAVSVVNAIVEQVTGDDLGGHVLTALVGETDDGDAAEKPTPMIATAVPMDDAQEPGQDIVALLPSAPPITLDPQTFAALERTLGASEPIAHLRPVVQSAAAASVTEEELDAPATATDRSRPDIAGSKIAYDDALIRMQAALDTYEARTRTSGVE